MSEATWMVPLTRLEIAGTLAAVKAVRNSAPGQSPEPLVTAAAKLEDALKDSKESP